MVAIVLIVSGVALYVLNIILIRHYIEKTAPGLIKADIARPSRNRMENIYGRGQRGQELSQNGFR